MHLSHEVPPEFANKAFITEELYTQLYESSINEPEMTLKLIEKMDQWFDANPDLFEARVLPPDVQGEVVRQFRSDRYSL